MTGCHGTGLVCHGWTFKSDSCKQFNKRDALIDSLWLSWRQPLICFLFSGEKFPTLTSHREGPFRNLNFRISQSNHISSSFSSFDFKFSPFCPRRPGEGWEPSGGGFAPLHRPFSRPAFFVAGPRVTEVSLSGSTRRLNYSGFKVLRGLWQKHTRRFSSLGVTRSTP